MSKHEYRFYITYTEVHSVYVEAESEDEARELAENMYSNGETEIEYERTEVKCDWSDEEDGCERTYEEG